MSDYAAPTGPPPPKVPEGWKAVWNSQYNEWFFVNLITKQSQWDKPTEPATGPGATGESAPPGYSSGPYDPVVSDTKRPLESNNPYGGPGIGETDEQMAARLQAEEQHRSSGHSPYPGQSQSNEYYDQQGQQQAYQQQGYPQQGQEHGSKASGLLGKLASKFSSKSSGGHGYPQQGYGGGYGQHGHGQHGYVSHPGYGGYGRPMGGGMMGGGYGRPPRKGMGVGGAAALGVGGGLVGGMLLADAMNDGNEGSYQDGYEDGADDGGGDFGGGDDGGGGD